MKYTLIVLLLISFTNSFSKANAQTTNRWGLAINPQQKKCARVWEGSICEKITAPKGWISVFPTWNPKRVGFFVTFDQKECAWTGTEIAACCTQLGLSYDASFQATSEKSKAIQDPRSPCFQLPITTIQPVTRPTANSR